MIHQTIHYITLLFFWQVLFTPMVLAQPQLQDHNEILGSIEDLYYDKTSHTTYSTLCILYWFNPETEEIMGLIPDKVHCEISPTDFHMLLGEKVHVSPTHLHPIKDQELITIVTDLDASVRYYHWQEKLPEMSPVKPENLVQFSLKEILTAYHHHFTIRLQKDLEVVPLLSELTLHNAWQLEKVGSEVEQILRWSNKEMIPLENLVHFALKWASHYFSEFTLKSSFTHEYLSLPYELKVFLKHLRQKELLKRAPNAQGIKLQQLYEAWQILVEDFKESSNPFLFPKTLGRDFKLRAARKHFGIEVPLQATGDYALEDFLNSLENKFSSHPRLATLKKQFFAKGVTNSYLFTGWNEGESCYQEILLIQDQYGQLFGFVLNSAGKKL